MAQNHNESINQSISPPEDCSTVSPLTSLQDMPLLNFDIIYNIFFCNYLWAFMFSLSVIRHKLFNWLWVFVICVKAIVNNTTESNLNASLCEYGFCCWRGTTHHKTTNQSINQSVNQSMRWSLIWVFVLPAISVIVSLVAEQLLATSAKWWVGWFIHRVSVGLVVVFVWDRGRSYCECNIFS